MEHKQSRFLVLFVLIALLATACLRDAEGVFVDGASDSILEESVLPLEVSEQNIAEARAVFDSSRAKWHAPEPFAYTMGIGFQTVSELQIDFDEDGSVLEERVVVDDGNLDSLPRSVDEVFDMVDAAISAFESGDLAVPEENECGDHFNARFDLELGYPEYFDSLGPCDDGVGTFVVISSLDDSTTETASSDPEGVAIHGDGEPADVPVDGCDRDAFSGEWLSPRAAGTELVEENDGVGGEGGVGVVDLALSDGGAQLGSADIIAVYESWFCTESEIIGVSFVGEEEALATINFDGTLSVGDWMLTRAADE